MSWKPEVIADSTGQWVGNALRFATKEEAEDNVRNLYGRWTAVRETRVVEVDDPVTHEWKDHFGTGACLLEVPKPPVVVEAAPTTGSIRVGPPKKVAS